MARATGSIMPTLATKPSVSSGRALGPIHADLVNRLRDSRGKRVVFLAHCLLDQNTRYLGGACRAGCVDELVRQCLDLGLAIVQLPCPEQHAWGGVLKRHLLRVYGRAVAHPLAWRLERALLPAALAHTRRVYRRLARRIASQIADYATSGVDVVAIIGVDASPSCGVATTLDAAACVDAIARVPSSAITVDRQNALIRQFARSGQGMFVAALRRELSRRDLHVPFVGHDLLEELAGRASNVDLGAIAAAR